RSGGGDPVADDNVTRVGLIVDDSLVRAGLAMILGADPGIEVVGQGDDGNEAGTLVQKHRPDVLLMDVRMPGLDGIAASTAASAPAHPPKVLLVTPFDMDASVVPGLEAGASGFLLKDAPPQDLARAVHVVAGGDAMLSPTITRRMLS